jgi:hypothetical protein
MHISSIANLRANIAKAHSKLFPGKVWCKKCGSSRSVDSSGCLATGWPECCGETMTIDAHLTRDNL